MDFPIEPPLLQLFAAEFIGTMLLVLLGNGVVANVVLKNTKGENGGWIVITFGWGMAVFVAVFCVASVSGAHINPAVTLGLALAGKFAWSQVPIYLMAQFAGGALGAGLVWLVYADHFAITKDPDAQLAAFCTAPAIRRAPINLISEIIGTAVLVYAVLHIVSPEGGLGSLDALPVGLLVLAIGLSLGGTTGYAINPARDLSPRAVHQILPIPGKRDSDWTYAWVPVVGPFLGAALAALCFYAIG
jgi:glycerol uptake facilitator protein